MFVRLQNYPQHLPCFRVAFPEQFTAYGEQSRKSGLNNSIEVFPIVATLESVYAADGQNTMETGKDRVRISCVQQLHRDVHKIWPFCREVAL